MSSTSAIAAVIAAALLTLAAYGDDEWSLELPLRALPSTTGATDFSIHESGTVWSWTSPDSHPSPVAAALPFGPALSLTIRDVPGRPALPSRHASRTASKPQVLSRAHRVRVAHR